MRDTVGGERNACLCVCPTDGEGVSKDAASPRPASPSCKVLLVDDDEELCSFLRAQLSLRYKVFWSTNGGDALRMAVTECPDVIVSDVMMPGMDGFIPHQETEVQCQHEPYSGYFADFQKRVGGPD